jgi:hypothetical protein
VVVLNSPGTVDADRRGGSVAEQGPWSDLLEHPESPFLREIIRPRAPRLTAM